MLYAHSLVALLSMSPAALAKPIEQSTAIQERKPLAGCPDGGYLLYSTPAGPTCISGLGLGIVATFAVPTAALIVANVKAAWTSNTPAPYPASVSASNKRDALVTRATSVATYNVESYPGFASHDANNPDSDDDWVGIFDSMIDYMQKEQVECLQAIVYGDTTNYENRFTIWAETGDGVNHRSC